MAAFDYGCAAMEMRMCAFPREMRPMSHGFHASGCNIESERRSLSFAANKRRRTIMRLLRRITRRSRSSEYLRKQLVALADPRFVSEKREDWESKRERERENLEGSL